MICIFFAAMIWIDLVLFGHMATGGDGMEPLLKWFLGSS